MKIGSKSRARRLGATMVVAGSVAIAAAAGGIAAATTDSTIPDDTADEDAEIVVEEMVVEVTDEGDPENRVLLISAPEVGDSAHALIELRGEVTGTATGDLVDAPAPWEPDATDAVEVEESGHTEEIGYTVDSTSERSLTVLSSSPDGSFVAEVTVESFEQTFDNLIDAENEFGPIEFFELPDLSVLIGVPTEQHINADHTILSATAAPGTTLTPEQEAALDSLVDDDTTTGVLLPDVPVGEGATWTVSASGLPAGLDLPFSLDFELVSLDGDDYVIALSVEGDIADLFDAMIESVADDDDEIAAFIDALFGGMSIGGTFTVTGEFTGNVSNPLERTSRVAADFDMEMSIPDMDGSASMTMSLELTETWTAG